MKKEEAEQLLKKYGQEHILRYYEELSAEQKEALLKQIAGIDFPMIERIQQNHSKEGLHKGKITPLAAMQLKEIEARKAEFRQIGVKAIEEGKVGAVLLAGGMGTRLGSDEPKGMYSIGLTKEVYIFERIIRNLLDVVEDTGSWIRLFIKRSNILDTIHFILLFLFRKWHLQLIIMERFIWKKKESYLPLPMEMEGGFPLWIAAGRWRLQNRKESSG